MPNTIPRKRELTEDQKEAARERTRKWRIANPERAREAVRKWYASHPKYIRKWDQANPQRKREAAQKWQKAHPECARQYRADHPEKARERQRRYQQANPEKMAAKEHKRRARKAGNGGYYTIEEWLALCKEFDNQCIGLGPHGGALTADHVIPVGDPGGTSYIENIQPLCQSCNSRKGHRTIDYRTMQHGILVEK